MEKSIGLMKSQHEDYDYSVFKNKDTLTKWKGKLDNEIVEYIYSSKYM